MGDAFTALADDEYTLFYNPAALGRHSGFSFNTLNPMFTVINPINHLDVLNDFPSTTAGMADSLMGIPIKTSVGVTPGFRMGRFGFSAFYSTEAMFNLMNKTHPVVDINYKEDRGFIMGYGFVPGERLRSEQATGEQLSIGFGVKYLKRSGLSGLFALAGTELGNAEGSDIDAIAQSLGKNTASGWGFDLGVEHITARGNTRWINGLVMKDMFNLRMSHDRSGSEVPAQDMAVNYGTAIEQNYEYFKVRLGVDIRNLIEEQEFLRRLHTGLEVSIPGISFMGGWRTGYFSYGIMTDIMMLKIYAGIFSEESNPGYKQQRTDQALLYVSLLNFRFDD